MLYIGPGHGTSLHRLQAFRRLGHSVTHVDPRAFLPEGRWTDRWLWHAGGWGLDGVLARGLAAACGDGHDVAWVNQGEYLGPQCLAVLRRAARRVVDYINDDPFSIRDRRRFQALRRALPLYDHCFLPRACSIADALRIGAAAASRFTFTADELAHRPLPADDPRLAAWRGHLVFAGTWFPERGPFLCRLLDLGVPLRVVGGRWQKAPEWPRLAACTLPDPLHGDDYTACLQGAAAALCLLSAANRDQHTSRSSEIPAVGGLLLAPRTDDHMAMFADGREALLFDSPEECAARFRDVLADPVRRAALAAAGRQRIIADGRMNERELSRLLRLALQQDHGQVGADGTRQ